MKARMLWANLISMPTLGKGEVQGRRFLEKRVEKRGKRGGVHLKRVGLLPSVLVLLLLYIFRRLPTRFSFQALRLAASREQKGKRKKKQKRIKIKKKEEKINEKGEKRNIKIACEVKYKHKPVNT